MTTIRTILADADYLTPERIRVYSLLLLVGFAMALAGLWVSADGLVDYLGRPLGTDFANVWSAGQMALRGEAAAAFDPAIHYREQQAIFSDPNINFYGWHYPPFFLLVASGLAILPYIPALILWQVATLAAYAGMIRMIASGMGALVLALAYPAVFVNLTHGQNGFLTAALLGAGLLLLDRRPWVAGILIGLLAYKPHFGLLIPLVLVLTGRWTTIWSATLTVVSMIAAATLIFGVDVWSGFIANAGFTSAVVLEAGSTGWEKIHSVFSIARSLGVPVNAAYAIHGTVVVALVATTIWLWRQKHVDLRIQICGLIAACVLITPYALDYDLMALAPAIALLAVHGQETGFRPYEKSILAFAWLAPMVSRAAASVIFVHPGLVGAFLILAIVIMRARQQARDAAGGNFESPTDQRAPSPA